MKENLEEVSTADLVNELRRRESNPDLGIESFVVDPYDVESVTVTGPAIILLITD